MLELGPSGGTYKEKPIPDWIRSEDGRTWDFERSIGDADSIELRTLAPDECVISPGLIYKLRRVEEVSNG